MGNLCQQVLKALGSHTRVFTESVSKFMDALTALFCEKLAFVLWSVSLIFFFFFFFCNRHITYMVLKICGKVW